MRQSKYIVASPDELYHFKYIKRIQGPDGKWRYYYGDRNTHRNIQQNMVRAKDLYRASDKEAKAGGKHMKNARKWGTRSDSRVVSRGTVNKSIDEYKKATLSAAKAGEYRKKGDRIVRGSDYYTVGNTARRNVNAAKKRIHDRIAAIRNKFKRK